MYLSVTEITSNEPLEDVYDWLSVRNDNHTDAAMCFMTCFILFYIICKHDPIIKIMRLG